MENHYHPLALMYPAKSVVKARPSKKLCLRYHPLMSQGENEKGIQPVESIGKKKAKMTSLPMGNR